jgi:hypothetical protein
LIRVTSWCIAISLAFTAWTGVKFGQKVERITGTMEQMSSDVEASRDDSRSG